MRHLCPRVGTQCQPLLPFLWIISELFLSLDLMPLWVLSLMEPGGGLSLKSRANGSQVILGNPNHTEHPGHLVPLPPSCTQLLPLPPVLTISDRKDTLALWDGSPGSPGLEKEEDFPFLCFIAQDGKKWDLESHETLISQSPRPIGPIPRSYSG